MRLFKSDRIPRPIISAAEREVLCQKNLDLEIGAGQGLHAIRYAQKNPERHLIAIERTKNKFAQLQRRLNDHPQLKNLTVIHGDAVSWLTHYLSPQQIQNLFVLYPNPYPKSKQANLRFHNSSFMELLLTSLPLRGRLHLATNLEWYAVEAKARLETNFGLRCERNEILRDPANARTHFEKKYLERGENCFDLVFIKDR